jgi:hypothetical protein
LRSLDGFDESGLRWAKQIAAATGTNVASTDSVGKPGLRWSEAFASLSAWMQRRLRATFWKRWKRVSDPIVLLLDHPDNGGVLSPEECRAIAPRLRELVALWPDNLTIELDYDKRQALNLAAGMQEEALANEPLEFL